MRKLLAIAAFLLSFAFLVACGSLAPQQPTEPVTTTTEPTTTAPTENDDLGLHYWAMAAFVGFFGDLPEHESAFMPGHNAEMWFDATREYNRLHQSNEDMQAMIALAQDFFVPNAVEWARQAARIQRILQINTAYPSMDYDWDEVQALRRAAFDAAARPQWYVSYDMMSAGQWEQLAQRYTDCADAGEAYLTAAGVRVPPILF